MKKNSFLKNLKEIIIFKKTGRAVIFMLLGIVSLALLSGIISAFISIPINNMYNNGYPGNIWGNALYDMLSRTVSNQNFVVFSSELFIDIPDRVFSFALALLLRKITTRKGALRVMPYEEEVIQGINILQDWKSQK